MDLLQYLTVKNIDFLSKREDVIPYIRDASYFTGELPIAVVLPKNENEISEILTKCYEENIKVVARGGGTSLTGSSISLKGSVVISMLRLNRILEFSGGDRYVHVQAGVRIDDLNSYLQSKGFLYPPDPASSLASTVGGTISTNAGGLRGTYYGSTKEWILGLGIVLADGRIIRTGGKILKRSAGYDLTSLFVGAEGTLGIIFDAYLKIVPRIENFTRIMVFFRKAEDMGKAIYQIKERGLNPLSAEFTDKISMNIISRISGIPVPDGSEVLLIIDIPLLSGNEYEKFIQIIKNSNPTVIKSLNAEESEVVYKARKGLYSSLLNEREREGEYIIIGDVVVPSSEVPEALNETRDLIEKFGLKISLFGHIGDGNIHANVFTNINSNEEMKKAEKFLEEFGDIALRHNGSVSAEHGIGFEKKELLIREFIYKKSIVNMEIMKSIKKILDPKNILNPGKVFDL